jgi:hypothetical protein
VKRSWWALALVLSLGVNVGLVGMMLWRHRAVDRWTESRAAGDHDPGARLADRLRLRGDVRERFLARQRELAGTVRELRPRIVRLEGALRRELVAPSPDRERVAAIHGELAEATRALENAFTDNVLDTREILDGRAEREFLRFVERFPGARRFAGGERERPRFAPGRRDGRPGREAPPEERSGN